MKKINTINMVTPGELTKGMWVIIYECKVLKTFEDSTTGEFGTKETPWYNPWFQGIPYKIVDVAGPMVAVETFKLQGQLPVILFDTRLVKFMEVSKKFGETYVKQMEAKNTPQQVTTGIPAGTLSTISQIPKIKNNES